jgi:hypothetical protein
MSIAPRQRPPVVCEPLDSDTGLAAAELLLLFAPAMYSGAIENGQMHGPGRLQYANGDVFEVRRGAQRLRARRACRGFALASSVMTGRARALCDL